MRGGWRVVAIKLGVPVGLLLVGLGVQACGSPAKPVRAPVTTVQSMTGAGAAAMAGDCHSTRPTPPMPQPESATSSSAYRYPAILRVDPPPPGRAPKVSAAQAWSTLPPMTGGDKPRLILGAISAGRGANPTSYLISRRFAWLAIIHQAAPTASTASNSGCNTGGFDQIIDADTGDVLSGGAGGIDAGAVPISQCTPASDPQVGALSCQ